MNTNMMTALESCVFMNPCVIGDELPMLLTYYSNKNGVICFAKTKADIYNATNMFTAKQIAHFVMIVDFCQTKNWLTAENSIHIFDSGRNGISHYVQINNADRSIQSSSQPSKYMIKYVPELLESNPCSIRSDSSISMLQTFAGIIKKAIKSLYCKNSQLYNGITIVNCFLYAMLWKLQYSENISDRPFSFAFSVIIVGSINTIIGSFISNLHPKLSHILFNGTMIYINYRLAKQVFSTI